MLTHLTIENYILIRHLEIDFGKGFSVITGETGAGKSLLVGALGLITGQRADISTLSNKEKKCIIEGTFTIENYGLEHFFRLNDIDHEPVVILRREINNQGKSRAFINDTPVTLQVLKALGDRLIDIHSQHQTIRLNESEFQLSLVDSYAHQEDILREYANLYYEEFSVNKELVELETAESKAAEERDYQQFLYDELITANFQPGEQEVLEAELQELSHAEEINSRLFSAMDALSESDTNVLSGLSDAQQHIEIAARFKPGLGDISDRIRQCYIELKDIASELERISGHQVSDPVKMEQIQLRLSSIYHLQQKHRVKDVSQLLSIKDNLEKKLSQIDSLQTQIEVLKKRKAEIHSKLIEKSSLLSENRKKAIPFIEKEMMSALHDLGMASAVFTVHIEQSVGFNRFGNDAVTFLFAANKGSAPLPLSRIASGGELSRIMLAIKSLILNQGILPTILFDEIDTGVSGEIAGKVGAIMKKIASKLQVITVTHLPQIAGKADYHYLAFKEEGSTETISNLKLLDIHQRVDEIARIMSNDVISDHARAAARQLMEN